MWLMRKINDEGTVHYLISKEICFTVGRMNSDINLSDSSISRKHCVIKVATKKECPFPIQTSFGVWMIDKKSKYGTFILRNHEWVKLEPEEVQELSNGTVIRFGLMNNIWRFEYKPLIACMSKLSRDQSEEVKLLLPLVDGKLINKWAKQCTIVFVNDLTVTVKVLLAMINGVPIVTINYLSQLVENVKKNLPWPDYKLFRPQIAESTLIPHLVSLNVEDHRKELFKGKTFVVPTKEQLENLREIITAAGGEVELLDLNGNCEKYMQENVIVIQLPCNQLIHPNKCTDSFKDLSDKLKQENNLRVVPETEIFQAIAYSSIEKYCNPKSLDFEIRQSIHNQNSCGDIIEEATPSQKNTKERTKENVAQDMESVGQCNSTRKMSSEEVTPGRKRKHPPQEQESTKKIILDKNKTADSDPLRTGDDDLLILLNGSDHQQLDEQTAERIAPKVTQIFKSAIENFEKRTSLSKSDNTAEDLRIDSEKNETANCRKRKMPENFRETDFDESEKRKRKLEDVTRSSNFSARERDSSGRASGPVGINKEKSFENKLKTPKHTEIIDTTDDQWIRRKNADHRGNDDQTDCDESEWINKNCKLFKKRETFKHEPAVICTEEDAEDIGEKLLTEGWYRSRSSRMRTLTVL